MGLIPTCSSCTGTVLSLASFYSKIHIVRHIHIFMFMIKSQNFHCVVTFILSQGHKEYRLFERNMCVINLLLNTREV